MAGFSPFPTLAGLFKQPGGPVAMPKPPMPGMNAGGALFGASKQPGGPVAMPRPPMPGVGAVPALRPLPPPGLGAPSKPRNSGYGGMF